MKPNINSSNEEEELTKLQADYKIEKPFAEFDGVKPTGTSIKDYNFDHPNLAALEDNNYGQKGVSLSSLLSSTIEPPRQEHTHHGLDNFFNQGRPLDFHSQLNYPKDHYDTAFSTIAPVRDPANNLLNHIIQETNLNYHNLNNLKVRPNDYLHGSPSFTSYGKVQPNYASNYPPMKPHQGDSNLQPPQLPLLPHLNPDDLTQIQQYERNKYPSSGLPAPQEPLKIPLFQLDQQGQNWPSGPGQYPYRDQKQSNFDIQASIDITPGDLRDGKYRK